eukprot:m.243463 g.243463  ORF g.243463 m.243463 type:complete len:149 (-) comp19021_c0_seq4:61-507(-)
MKATNECYGDFFFCVCWTFLPLEDNMVAQKRSYPNACQAAIEVAYPVSEVASTIVLSGGLALSITVFPLLRFLLPESKLNALNWVAAGCCGFCAVWLHFGFREQRRRLAVDRPASTHADPFNGAEYVSTDQHAENCLLGEHNANDDPV